MKVLLKLKNTFYFVSIFNETNILGFSFEQKYGFQLPEIFGYSQIKLQEINLTKLRSKRGLVRNLKQYITENSLTFENSQLGEFAKLTSDFDEFYLLYTKIYPSQFLTVNEKSYYKIANSFYNQLEQVSRITKKVMNSNQMLSEQLFQNLFILYVRTNLIPSREGFWRNFSENLIPYSTIPAFLLLDGDYRTVARSEVLNDFMLDKINRKSR